MDELKLGGCVSVRRTNGKNWIRFLEKDGGIYDVEIGKAKALELVKWLSVGAEEEKEKIGELEEENHNYAMEQAFGWHGQG